MEIVLGLTPTEKNTGAFECLALGCISHPKAVKFYYAKRTYICLVLHFVSLELLPSQ